MTTAAVDPATAVRVMTSRGHTTRHVADTAGRALCGVQCEGRSKRGAVTCKHCQRLRNVGWVDWVAVERAKAGKEVGRYLTRAERFVVAEWVVARGGRAGTISNLLNVNGSMARRLYEAVTSNGEVDEDGMDGAA